MFLNNRHSIHFSDESHSKRIEEFVPKNSLGQKKFFWPMDKICLFTESSSMFVQYLVHLCFVKFIITTASLVPWLTQDDAKILLQFFFFVVPQATLYTDSSRVWGYFTVAGQGIYVSSILRVTILQFNALFMCQNETDVRRHVQN